MFDYKNVRRITPNVYINNRLTAKPKEAVASLRKIIGGQTGYQLRLQQDYSKGVVRMQLEGLCGICGPKRGESFHQVFGIQEVPITSNKKAYNGALRKMLANPAQEPIEIKSGTIAVEQEAVKPKKKSFFQIALEYFLDI